MSGEREAVEARAREHREKYLKTHLRRLLADAPSVTEVELMADFSLAENAELRKELEQEKNAVAHLAQSTSALLKRAEAAEAEIVKLREAMTSEKLRKVAREIAHGFPGSQDARERWEAWIYSVFHSHDMVSK